MKTKTPVLFVSHGSPMLAQDAHTGADYRAWSETLPRPKAILVFSAHWEAPPLQFGETVRHDELVYDFYGFPEALYRMQFPAPGAGWLVDAVNDVLGEKMATAARGLDHGVWVPFIHMWPEADLPILQMSMPSTFSNQELYELGAKLSPLREQGVMIVGSGTLTHNLREGFKGGYAAPPEWVTEFDDWVERSLLHNRAAILDWQAEAPHAQRNHPTPDHFRPLLIAAGAAGEDEPVSFPITGFEMMVFSRRSVQFS